jgi:hypothetical protein
MGRNLGRAWLCLCVACMRTRVVRRRPLFLFVFFHLNEGRRFSTCCLQLHRDRTGFCRIENGRQSMIYTAGATIRLSARTQPVSNISTYKSSQSLPGFCKPMHA